MKIVKIAANAFNLVSISFCIAIVDEITVAAMQFFYAPGMFDRAPELLGSSRDFLDIGDQTVEVAAIGAVYFFNQIQIVEILMIEDDVIPAFDFWNTVSRKARCLIEADASVKN